MQNSSRRMWSVLGAAFVVLGALMLAAPAMPASSAGPTITIWTDKDRNAAVTKVAGDWGATRGVTINVVEQMPSTS